MTQILSNDGKFTYIGGSRIMDAKLIDRAQRIGHQAISALPPTQGYVGIDLVLGEQATDDYLIEINPRLTTSYLGLRQIADSNLAQAMLQIAKGEEPLVSFSPREVRFHADGTVL